MSELHWHGKPVADRRFARDELVVLSSGGSGCDDFEVFGAFLAERDFSLVAAARAFVTENPLADDPYSFDFQQFADWLASAGYLKRLPTRRINLGSFSEFMPREDMLPAALPARKPLAAPAR